MNGFLFNYVSERKEPDVMPRNIVKILDKNFSDMKAGQSMHISSPEAIADYIRRLQPGEFKTPKQMRFELAKDVGADNTCPVSTGIFLRVAIEAIVTPDAVEMTPLPFWRVIDETHPVLKKLGILPEDIARLRAAERHA